MKAHVYFQNRHGDVKRVAEVEMTAELAANVNVALEHVYASLQNIYGSWSFGQYFEGCNDRTREGQLNADFRENVKFVGEYFEVEDEDGCKIKLGERSMMVGDLITLGGKTYEVASFGFKEYQGAA